MLGDFYSGPIKNACVSLGVHPYLKAIYETARPYRLVKIHEREDLRNNCDKLYEFGTSETLDIGLPSMYKGDPDHPQFKKVTGTHYFKKPYIAVINEGRILEKTGICTTKDHTILLDSVNSRECHLDTGVHKRRQVVDILNKQRANSNNYYGEPNIELGVSFIRAPYGYSSATYSHWLQSYLTRLAGIEHYTNETGEEPTIILEPDPPQWITQSLEYFGYENTVSWDPSKNLRVKKLLVPSVRRIEFDRDYNRDTDGKRYKILSPHALGWVRKKATEGCKKASENRIFVRRTDADTRRIRNFDELQEPLRNAGFTTCVPGSLDFADQVRVFANADVIMGPHGAGIANQIFATDAKVIEFFGNKVVPTEYLMAESLGHEYKGIFATGVDDDIIIEPDDLTEILSSI